PACRTVTRWMNGPRALRPHIILRTPHASRLSAVRILNGQTGLALTSSAYPQRYTPLGLNLMSYYSRPTARLVQSLFATLLSLQSAPSPLFLLFFNQSLNALVPSTFRRGSQVLSTSS